MRVWHKFFHHFRSQTSSTRRHRGASLLLEALEERCVPATFYVNVNGGSDANNGSKAAPFASIEEAVIRAKQFAIGESQPQQDNNTILVAAGTYTSTTLPNDANTLGFPSVVGVVDQQLTILGGYDASFSTVNGASIIDGGSQVRGVVVASSIRATSLTLDGFTIQNGFAGPQTIVAGRLTAFGGGMFIDMGATPTNTTNIIRNVTFTNNTAHGADNTITAANSGTNDDFGEGVGGGLAAIFANNVVLQNVTFDGNRAIGGHGPRRGGTGVGGAIYGGEATHYTGESLTFANNQALGGSADTGMSVTTDFGEEFAGGFGGAVGLLNSNTSIDFSSVVATSNLAQGGNGGSAPGDEAGYGRGGAFYSEDSNVSLTDAVLSNNKAATATAYSGAFATTGGGLYATARSIAATVNLNRVSILDNEVSAGTVEGGQPGMAMGGGLAADRAANQTVTVNVLNSVIAGNHITAATVPGQFSGGGGVWVNGATVNLTHTAIADNTIPLTNADGSALRIYDGAINVAYSIIADHNTGTLNAVTGGVPGRTGTINFTQKTLFSNNVNNGTTAANVVTGDAKFVNAAAGNYNLQSGSAAIDAATGSTDNVDRNINARVGTPDLGAFEFGLNPKPQGAFAKLGAFRTSDGSWSLDTNGNRVFDSSDRLILNFGGAGRTGVAGDWTNNGITEIGDFTNGEWRLDINDDGVVDGGDRRLFFGRAGDTPVVGNFYGTGVRVGVFRTGPDGFTGEFIIDTNNDGIMDAGDETFSFGIGGDRVVVGDWTGDGKDKVGVFRSTGDSANSAIFSLDTNNDHNFTSADAVFIFGRFTDGLVVGDWTGDGISKVGVYRPATDYNAPLTAVFSLDNNNDHTFDAGDQVFLFGYYSDQFLAGNWAQPQRAASSGSGMGQLLTPDLLDPIKAEAVGRWTASGTLSADQVARLDETRVQIGNLTDGVVGLDEGGAIALDQSAAGNGWYVDPTPQTDTAFADSNGPAAGKMDLLTVMEHELGHELGYADNSSGGVMDGVLTTGTRRSP